MPLTIAPSTNAGDLTIEPAVIGFVKDPVGKLHLLYVTVNVLLSVPQRFLAVMVKGLTPGTSVIDAFPCLVDVLKLKKSGALFPFKT